MDKKEVVHIYIRIYRWMDKEEEVGVDNGILLSHKKEWNNAICRNMDQPRDLSHKVKLSQRQIYDSHMWNLKCDTKELNYKTETDSQTLKSNLWLPKGEMRGEG